MSSTFSLIKLNNVNVTFLDNTNLRGYDGADVATLGKYKVETRMGMIEHCNSRNFDDVDGILGFGWADQPRSAALLKTLTQSDRPGMSHDLTLPCQSPCLDDMPVCHVTLAANSLSASTSTIAFTIGCSDVDVPMLFSEALSSYLLFPSQSLEGVIGV